MGATQEQLQSRLETLRAQRDAIIRQRDELTVRSIAVCGAIETVEAILNDHYTDAVAERILDHVR